MDVALKLSLSGLALIALFFASYLIAGLIVPAESALGWSTTAPDAPAPTTQQHGGRP